MSHAFRQVDTLKSVIMHGPVQRKRTDSDYADEPSPKRSRTTSAPSYPPQVSQARNRFDYHGTNPSSAQLGPSSADAGRKGPPLGTSTSHERNTSSSSRAQPPSGGPAGVRSMGIPPSSQLVSVSEANGGPGPAGTSTSDLATDSADL